MAKLEIPVRVYMGEFEEIINELKHLQTYKLFEGDDKVLINCDDVVEIFANHLRAETLSGSTIEPERKKENWIPVSERLPDEDRNVLVSVHFLGLETKHKTGWNDHIKESWYVDIACQIDGEWTSASDEYKVVKNRHIVTAWMPLPDPWRGEDDERPDAVE